MSTLQKIMFVLLGVIGAVAIFCVVVGIGCACNGVTFGQQIADWFGSAKPVVDDVADKVVETALNIRL